MANVDVARGRGEYIRVERSVYKEKEYVGVRLYYTDQKDGEIKPTKKGCNFPAALLPEVIKALESLKGKA